MVFFPSLFLLVPGVPTDDFSRLISLGGRRSTDRAEDGLASSDPFSPLASRIPRIFPSRGKGERKEKREKKSVDFDL